MKKEITGQMATKETPRPKLSAKGMDGICGDTTSETTISFFVDHITSGWNGRMKQT